MGLTNMAQEPLLIIPRLLSRRPQQKPETPGDATNVVSGLALLEFVPGQRNGAKFHPVLVKNLCRSLL
jgi:hypothetical protein